MSKSRSTPRNHAFVPPSFVALLIRLQAVLLAPHAETDMLDTLLHAPANIRFLPRARYAQRVASPTAWRSCRDTIRLWMQRARQRQALAELGPHLLRDIAVSYEEARREARKPFWQ
jgi:uncharacterized protein YjiS (DUF1127 family)